MRNFWLQHLLVCWEQSMLQWQLPLEGAGITWSSQDLKTDPWRIQVITFDLFAETESQCFSGLEHVCSFLPAGSPAGKCGTKWLAGITALSYIPAYGNYKHSSKSLWRTHHFHFLLLYNESLLGEKWKSSSY